MRIREASPRDLASLAASCARLGWADSTLWLRLGAAVSERLSAMSGPQLATSLRALGEQQGAPQSVWAQVGGKDLGAGR